ncbi:MAG: hypothetical protein A2Y64_00825 [Candidatus Coatesbacteria bacterium RBG_13_66_14]|uniref:Uncharacterized protein n=1 Tax=Candidatus Coatesbacteria bacterium RBG_13_66_14 TaxID=1817816 RepID=A0A1F5EVZ3_9BACT|nr:MAG: hypothetical protein A2Y64_00825 [Candidatus Coatesbacteria bacterium RBG_13_66_14]
MAVKKTEHKRDPLWRLTRLLARHRARQGVFVALLVAVLWMAGHLYAKELSHTTDSKTDVVLTGNLYATENLPDPESYEGLARSILKLAPLRLVAAAGRRQVRIAVGDDSALENDPGFSHWVNLGSCSPFKEDPATGELVSQIHIRPIGSAAVSNPSDLYCLAYHETLHTLPHAYSTVELTYSDYENLLVYRCELKLIARLIEMGKPPSEAFVASAVQGYRRFGGTPDGVPVAILRFLPGNAFLTRPLTFSTPQG